MSDDVELPDSAEYEEFDGEDKNAPEKAKRTYAGGRKSGLEAIDPPKDQNVTGQERDFCLEYFRTGNARLAAKKAGFKVNPDRKGHDLLKDQRIKNYIHAIMQVHEEHLELERETFVDMLKYMVIARIDDFMHDWETLKDMNEVPKELLHAVKEVTVNDYKNAKGQVTRTKTSIKLVDKQPYMDMWAKIRNFYEANNRKTVSVEINFT